MSPDGQDEEVGTPGLADAQRSDTMTSMASILSDKRISPSAHYATQHAEDVLRTQNVDVNRGLSAQEAEFRRKLVGPNELVQDEKESLMSKFIDQFKNPLILLLFGSATISVIMGQYDDAISITLVSGVLGSVQVVWARPCTHSIVSK